MTPVALRPATPADSEFCYQLHKAAMRSYVTATWGWDEVAALAGISVEYLVRIEQGRDRNPSPAVIKGQGNP